MALRYTHEMKGYLKQNAAYLKVCQHATRFNLNINSINFWLGRYIIMQKCLFVLFHWNNDLSYCLCFENNLYRGIYPPLNSSKDISVAPIDRRNISIQPDAMATKYYIVIPPTMLLYLSATLLTWMYFIWEVRKNLWNWIALTLSTNIKEYLNARRRWMLCKNPPKMHDKRVLSEHRDQ